MVHEGQRKGGKLAGTETAVLTLACRFKLVGNSYSLYLCCVRWGAMAKCELWTAWLDKVTRNFAEPDKGTMVKFLGIFWCWGTGIVVFLVSFPKAYSFLCVIVCDLV